MTNTSNLRIEFDYKAFIQSEECKLTLALYSDLPLEEAIGIAVENEVRNRTQQNLSNEGCFVSKNNNIYVFRKTANDFFVIERLDHKDKSVRQSVVEETNWEIAARRLAQLMCWGNVVDDSVEKDIVADTTKLQAVVNEIYQALAIAFSGYNQVSDVTFGEALRACKTNTKKLEQFEDLQIVTAGADLVDERWGDLQDHCGMTTFQNIQKGYNSFDSEEHVSQEEKESNIQTIEFDYNAFIQSKVCEHALKFFSNDIQEVVGLEIKSIIQAKRATLGLFISKNNHKFTICEKTDNWVSVVKQDNDGTDYSINITGPDWETGQKILIDLICA